MVTKSLSTNDIHGFNASPQGAHTDTSSLRRAVIGVTCGNMIEWFDFALYSSLATIIGHVFFRNQDHATQLLSIYATFAAGFLIRPIGSLVFGPIGDRYGRRTALTLSITLMSVATFCIAFLPGYDRIGIAAPILLLCIRMLQGLSTGGEYGGSCTFIAEHAPDAKRSFMTSWLEFGNISGFLIGGAVVNVLTFSLGTESMAAWGWRIPFVIAGFAGLVALYLRLNVDESPVFRQMQENESHQKGLAQKRSLVQLLIAEWPQLLKCAGLTAVFNITYYVALGYLPGYLSDVAGHPVEFGNLLAMVATLVMLALIPFAGMLSDRFGGVKMIRFGCLLIIVGAIPAFMLMKSSSVMVIFGALMTLVLAQLMFEGAMPATLTSLFRAPVRYSGLAISYNVSVSLLGGTAPLINTWLIHRTGNPLIPAWYMIGGAVLGLVALKFVKDLTGKPLPM
ncbi:MFS transporter [Paraburkholderia madseniana]|uniref:MFS transporter n=1 Tax=Paraburkholderia madseniana TaxID=2599607 RepID=A0A6N6W8C8_9BURK|nr:MFS transporter [Paraburkholderia madseniana]KAE8756703.1 MFS transporter [Paraburkholderia madseniana]